MTSVAASSKSARMHSSLLAQCSEKVAVDMPASREMASALASAYPTRAKTSAAASNRRRRCTERRTSSGGAWRPRGTVGAGRSAAAMALMVGRLPVRMLRTLLPLGAIVAVAVAGCASQSTSNDSSGKSRAEQRLVAHTIEDFESAASKGDHDQICRDLRARSLAVRYAERGGTCEHAVDGALKDTDAVGLTVESVRVSGTDATASVKAD